MIEWFSQNHWAFWLTAAIILALVEILMLDFLFLIMGLAALTTAGASILTGSFVQQVLIFAAVSLIFLLLLRPPLIRKLHQSSPDQPMNSAGLVGASAVVTQTVTAETGLARIAGDIWTARPEEAQEVIPEGASTTVTAIRGATAYLSAK